ncbi:urea transporter [Actinacidiphila sp. ITFR-21]|uniref:urea transporter n=1 Tax=Actinacidiphila sp. ITFR-21 TaxID=3075199 RepID=UPI002889AB1F|nr:urea transporter [Streptomyces sp. ITFR-21]WNI16189.1 urea transporter [Streptomyces sp. ITFR-21]
MPSVEIPTRRKRAEKPFLSYLVASARGVGQVDLQPGAWTGAVILLALWTAGWEIGVFATLGTLVSTMTALALGSDRSGVRQGLQGYCGCLTGIALVTYLGHHVATYVLAVVGAVVCTILMAALSTVLAPTGLTALTAPFCLVSGVMVLGAPDFGRIWHGAPAAVSSTTGGGTGLSWDDLWHGFFCNVAQVFLVDKWQVGLIMLVGLALAGARVVLFAGAGSIVGMFAAWALGAPTRLIANGIYGYNAVLVAVAVGAVLLAPTPWNAAYALFGAAASTGLTASLTSLFKPFGGHTFTWPFILTAWVLMAAVPRLPRFRPSG